MPRCIKTILVDDEARLRRGVERLVKAQGEDWEIVGSFSSGDECLKLVQEQNLHFDLLITDVKMPGIDGLTLIKELKQIASFHAMVISGFDDFQFLQTAIREGASDYLIKPIDRDDFNKQLEKIKNKIVSNWHDSQYLEEVQLKASQLTHVKQLQLLSEMTWKQDLSQLEWTKDFPNGQYLLMYISMDNLSSKSKLFQKEDWKAWSFALDNICEEMTENLSSSFNIIWRWKGEDLSFWMLLHGQDSIQEESFVRETIQFADKVKQNIKKYTPFTCSIAVSRKINDLTLLASLKEELLTYIQFRLLLGHNQVITSATIEECKSNKKGSNSKEIENRINKILLSLDSKDQSKINHEISNFLNMFQTLSSPEEIEQSLQVFGIRMINYIMKHSQENDEIPLLDELFGLIKKTGNLLELRNEVYHWIKKVLGIIIRNNEVQHVEHIDVAKKWIIKHLEQNITIQKIASQVYMNPTYFCEYFKNQTGETVLDFVTRARIEKARDLLVNTNLKIYDISEKVGYSDTKYFSKLFKKHYGETPSKYKEKVFLDQS
ncbi:response regulator [Metabacillus litoralis]|uniref:response regulator n=1 Tax=Metabacillus TaxID=2675233 RepID=UPI001BA1DF8F|nr:helix-turn-helix domain-containing protein [Metabacillus litoralis]MCM3408398.1 response regulator [Metabacillus litoralis]UHA59928.1 response regulator [Metabacillus litoralis]